MKILIYDKMQVADGAPDEIKSPALSDIYEDETSFEISFDDPELINCVGIGYTDATVVTISNGSDTRTISITKNSPYHNGLYVFDDMYPGGEYVTEYEYGYSFTISHNGSFIGRVGIGVWRKLGTSPTKEIGFYTTEKSRVTMSGQVIPGAGGYSGRRFEADVRYKIDADIYNDIELAYPGQIMKSFPYFIYTEDEQHKLPANMLYFYASTSKPLSLLQSSSYRFLYSYKFSFFERF